MAIGVSGVNSISSSTIIGSSLSSTITVPIVSPALIRCGSKLVRIPSDIFRMSMYSGFAFLSASILPLNRFCTPLFFRKSLTIALPSYGCLFSSSRITGTVIRLNLRATFLEPLAACAIPNKYSLPPVTNA